MWSRMTEGTSREGWTRSRRGQLGDENYATALAARTPVGRGRRRLGPGGRWELVRPGLVRSRRGCESRLTKKLSRRTLQRTVGCNGG